MPDLPPVQGLIAGLAAAEISERLASVAGLVGQGASVLGALACLLRDGVTGDVAKVWAIIAISQIGDDDQGTALRGLLNAADSDSARVRHAALQALGGLQGANAVPLIARHLADHAEVPGAWFEDDCRVSQAAAEALRWIGTEEALRALADGDPRARERCLAIPPSGRPGLAPAAAHVER